MYIYDAAGTLTGTLTGFNFQYPAISPSENLAVDLAGNLYVTDNGNHAVKIFAPPYVGAPRILNAPKAPFNVAVDGLGDVAAGYAGDPGGVYFYAKGASTGPTSPTNDVPGGCENCDWTAAEDLAFDGRGNLYLSVGYETFELTLYALAEIEGGVHGHRYTLFAGNLAEPESVQITTKGLIAYDDCWDIYTYDPPVNGKLGQPIETTPLSPPSCPFAFTPGNVSALAVEYGNETIGQFSYPAGGSPTRSLEVGPGAFVGGVAVNPPAIP